jgi:hypothetical protein
VPIRPLLVLPNPADTSPPAGAGGAARFERPSPKQQRRRLEPQYQRLKHALSQPGGLLTLRAEPTGIAPERTIVFEIAGSVQAFYKAASRIPGLEFIAEEDASYASDADFYAIDRADRPAPGKDVSGRRYLAMPSVAALQEIVGLFAMWRRRRKLPLGFAPWKHLFLQLKNMRSWGPEDRISDAAVACWQQELDEAGITETMIEAELFFHDDESVQAAAIDDLRVAVQDLSGELVARTVITPIHYHAALLRIPAAGVRQIMARAPVRLVMADQVMFLAPQASLRTASVEARPPDGRPVPILASRSRLSPIAALFDGYPLQQHALLANRLDINDEDELESRATVDRRVHGTAMASLILHGDLNADEESLPRPLYVRPITYGPPGQREQPPPDRLLIDTIYRAVVRMKDSDTPGGPAAPDVFLVNLSMGDYRRPFAGPISSWARLLDYLAERYGLLFVVSAGNITDDITVGTYATMALAETSDPYERTRVFLNYLKSNAHTRTLLAPAEGLNALTVGAAHDDNVPTGRPFHNSLDPFPLGGFSNMSSAMGLGHRRTVKPDILLPGGKERLNFRSTKPLVLGVPDVSHSFGLKAAAPDSGGRGALDRRALIHGTSVATALATRRAHQICDVLSDGGAGSNHADMPADYWPVVVKCLLAHSARWPSSAETIGEIFGPDNRRLFAERADNIARVLGHGIPDIARVLDCEPSQATFLGYGQLRANSGHQYRIPLPECLRSVTDPRTLVLTLAWFSPVSPVLLDYRRAQLQVDAPDHSARIGVSRTAVFQASDHSSKRGSLVHELYSGESAVPFVDDGHLVVRVWCRPKPDYPPLDLNVRYALAITIEAGTLLQIYEQTKARVRPPVRPQP